MCKIEITSKLDFIWRRKFGVEKEEVETMASVNKILLESILPAHVADYFLISPHRHTEVCSVIQYGHSRVYRFRSSGAAALRTNSIKLKPHFPVKR